MKLHYLKPLHGWRALAGEVGVIVLGVLLALGAQQLAQEMQMQDEVKAFRKTIDHEIGLNLYVYDVRVRQAGCVDKHLDEVSSWLARARTGRPVSLRGGGPLRISPYRSAWDNRNAAVFNKLPENVRAKYAEFYDELTNNIDVMGGEHEQWQALHGFAEPGPLSLEDRRSVRAMLRRAAGNAAAIVKNVEQSAKIASDLGIRKQAPQGIAIEEIEKRLAACRPLVVDEKV